MNKRIFIIGGIILVVLIVAIALLRRPTGTSPQTSATPSDQATESNLPNAVAFPALNGSLLTYLNLSSGNFASYDLATNKQQEFGPFLTDPANVIWSPDGTKVLNVSSDDGSTSVIAVTEKNPGPSNGGNMRSNLGVVQPLNSRILTPSWSADGKQILYQFIDPASNQSTITVADADGNNWQSIVAIPSTLIRLSWSPLGTYAIGLDYTTNPPDYELIAISSKTVKKLATSSVSDNVKWSPSGQLALLDSGGGESLQIANVNTAEVTTITIPGLVQQFTWQDETHLVGVSNGKFVTIDLSTKQSKVVGDASVLVAADAGKVYEFAEVLGIYKDTIIYTQDGAISSTALSQ